MSSSDWGENLDATEQFILGSVDILDGLRGLTPAEDAALAAHRKLTDRLAKLQAVADAARVWGSRVSMEPDGTVGYPLDPEHGDACRALIAALAQLDGENT